MVRRRRKPPSGQRWSIFKCCRPVGFPSTYKGVYDEKNQLSIQYRHCVKIGYDNGVTVSIDCIAVENRIPRNMYECSEPYCRICNDPPEYVKLVRSEAVDHNLHKYDDDSGLD